MTAKFRALNLIMAIVMAMGLVFQASPPTNVASAPLAAFSSGNIVVYRVGDGAGSLVNTGNPVFLDEFTPAGTLVQSIAMPVVVDGSNRAFFAAGTSTSEGLLTRSTDGKYLLATGYASTYATSLSATPSATVNRVVGRVNGSGSIDTTTALTDFATGSSPRAASSTNGTDLWVDGGAGGVRYTTLGATTSTQISTTVTNNRQVNIFNGQLYVSGASGAYRLSTVGTGLPTTAGQTYTNLPGFPTAAPSSPYAFFFADLDSGVSGVDTVYVADDGTSGGILKYSLVSGTWTANGSAGVAADAYRGVTGSVSGTTVTLFATRKGSSTAAGGGELVSLEDASGYNGTITGTPTLLATAGANTAFRGVALTPDVPPLVASTNPTNGATDVAINATITVNFNEPVTATGTWATLTCGGPSLPVTLGGSGSAYTIDPDADLPFGSSCTATVLAAQVTDLDGTPDPMAADYGWSFSTAADLPPTVSSTSPITDAVDVAIDSTVSVTFSEPVTVTGGWYGISCTDSSTHTAVVSGGPTTYTLDPDSDFSNAETCTVTLTAALITDQDGTPDPLASDYIWSFTTIALDAVPYVDSTTPVDNAVDVALDSNVTIYFSEHMTFTPGFADITCGTSGTHTYSEDTSLEYVAVLLPDVDFANGEVCTVTIDRTKVADQDGTPDNLAADYVFDFTTIFDPAPTVTVVTPTNGAIGVAENSNIDISFSEPVDVADGWYSISCAYSGLHTATVSGGPTDFTLNPDTDFTPTEVCSVTLDRTKITDQDTYDPLDNMAADYSWSFTIFYDPDTIVPIAVARAAGNLWTGTIQGNVTLVPGLFSTSRSSFAIQDATGGLYIYPAYGYIPPTMALGDVVKVKGTIKNFGGLLEFDPVASVTWISTGTVPTPLVTATGSVASTQGKLIEVEGTITLPPTPPAPGAAHYTFYINDGSGQVTVYVYKLTNIDLRSFESGQQMRIIGESMAYSSSPQLQPRYPSDIIDLRPPTVTGSVPLPDATDVNPHRPVSATFSKAMDPDSLTGNFTIGGVTGSVSYDDATHTATFTPDTALAPYTTYTATLSTSVTDSYGVNLATAHSWSFTTGALDTTPPSILTRSPLPDAVGVSAGTEVSVSFDEELAPGSLNLDHFVLTGPYGGVPAAFDYDPVTFSVTLTPSVSLLYSSVYTMTVTADTADFAGNPLGSDDVWSFTTMAEPPMQVYFGDLHNHTSYSDGSGTPTQALAAGEVAGFDFMAISDHSYAISDPEWEDTLAAVEAATDAGFVALRGFEYTQGAEGHINVWNSTRHATRTNVAGCTYCDYTPNLEAGSTVQGFYPWLISASNVGLDSSGTIMQFNHPGWINFNDWFFHPEISSIARLEEVGNGNGTSYTFSEEAFIRSLDYGWKVGATNNGDTHTDQWGTNTEDRTGVVMPELTKSALLEALRLRRTFATEDMNFSLTMKANGAWMGSEIANTGNIEFLITGQDADGELAALVELITDQGKVAAYATPYSSNFTWEPEFTITTGVHYYYVKVTQVDGDRIVSSPVWTMGSEDIAITDVTIQPAIPTTNNASLVTVRVTNRVAANRTVNIVLKINDVQLGSAVEVIVPGNSDGYANFSWQPVDTGDVTVTAEMQGAPAGDNPDDNSASLYLTVTDEMLPLILIDAGHGNLNATGNDMKPFFDDLSAHNYNVLKNLDALTTDDLNPAVVKLLIITAPETAYTAEELTAIGNYIDAGGSLWMLGLSDYTGSTSWANTVADRENAILVAIEAATGQQVNMRVNDDEIVDGNTNNGYAFGPIWHDFPAAATTGIGVNVESVATWSMNSIIDRNGGALTAEDTGVQILMQGDFDLGCTTSGSYTNPNHTSNLDADGAGDAYLYNPTWTCDLTAPPLGAVPLPGAAVVQLADGAGRIMLYGDSNDPFTIFAYTAGDGKQNELFNLQSVMWLLGEPLEKSTIAEARAQTVEDQPDNLNKVVWVEGEITAAYGEFFNVLYVQDDTGGIAIHAPAGDIDPSALTRGTHVRAVGTIDIYNGDTEIQFFEAEMVQVIPPDAYDATPLALTTAEAALESNQGWLTTVTGRVISKSGTDTIVIDDGSGPVRIFLDGYNGTLADILLYDLVQVTGLASEDGNGSRIRVRNHNYHPGIDDDVIILGHAYRTVLPLIAK